MDDLDFTNPDPADDRVWILLDRFLAGASTAEDAGAIRAWLAADPTRREWLENTRRIREIAAGRPPARSVDQAWRQAVVELDLGTDSTLKSDGARPAERPPFRLTLGLEGGSGLTAWFLRIAAVLVLVAGGAVFWGARIRGTRPAPPPVVTLAEYVTKPGQRLALRLPDGTLVLLAPGSSLRKPSDYGVAARILRLEGQAYFDVAHDATRPLTVETVRGVVRDLGTRFVIRAYPGDPTTDIVVSQGRVAVDTVLLERGQRARLFDGGRLEVAKGVSLERYFAWIDGRLVFRDKPLRDVAVQLARWYDVEIRFADASLAARRLTASFEDVPLMDIFNKIAGPLGLEVTRDGRTYTLRQR